MIGLFSHALGSGPLKFCWAAPKPNVVFKPWLAGIFPVRSRVERERKHIHTLSETTLVKLAADRELPLSGWDVEETQDPLVVSIECPKKGT